MWSSITCDNKYVHPAASHTDRQDFAGFVTRAHATKGILSRVLAMLSAIQHQSLTSIVLKRSNQSEAELCFALDRLLSITPVQIAQPVQHVVREIQTTVLLLQCTHAHMLVFIVPRVPSLHDLSLYFPAGYK